jgi:hypothetical protein
MGQEEMTSPSPERDVKPVTVRMTSNNGWSVKDLKEWLSLMPDDTRVTTNGLFKQTLRFNFPQVKGTPHARG